MGLTLVAELAEEADAEVRAERREPSGTRVVITLLPESLDD
jgi:nitrate/nitrite-specific signal transduction histidine kinase